MKTILNLPEQFFWNGHGRKISPVKPFRNLTPIGNRRDMKNLTLGEMVFSNVDGDAKVLR